MTDLPNPLVLLFGLFLGTGIAAIMFGILWVKTEVWFRKSWDTEDTEDKDE